MYERTAPEMAGTLGTDMRGETLCISSNDMLDQMSRIFSLNKNAEGQHVYNHAGIEPRTGDSSKFVVFADVNHRTPDYIPTKNSRNVLRLEVVNLDLYVEVSAAITPAIGQFVPPGRNKELLMDLAAHPYGCNYSAGFILTDRTGFLWDATATRMQGRDPYLVIVVHSEGDLEDLMNRMFDLDPDYRI